MHPDALKPLGRGLWIGEGPVVPFFAGFPYPTRMVVIRLGDGGLFVWSPVALTDTLRAEMDALGPVRHLVSPNLLHHLYLGEVAPELFQPARGTRGAARILDWPIERVVIAHDDLPADAGRAFVRQALGWLLGCEPVP